MSTQEEDEEFLVQARVLAEAIVRCGGGDPCDAVKVSVRGSDIRTDACGHELPPSRYGPIPRIMCHHVFCIYQS